MNSRLTCSPGAWLAATLALSISATALAAEPRPSHAAVGRFLARHRIRQDCAPGEQIFLHTPQAAGKFVGNDLNCSSCHLDAGRRPDSAPMWAAYVLYPAYGPRTATSIRWPSACRAVSATA